MSPPDDPRQSLPPVAVALTFAQQLDALEIECKFRTVKIRHAARMKDVIQLANVEVRGELVARQSEIRGLKQLQIACETRLRELVGAHLLELRNTRDLAAMIQMRSHFQHREWSQMKAFSPQLFREADGEAERFQRQLEREADQTRTRARRS